MRRWPVRLVEPAWIEAQSRSAITSIGVDGGDSKSRPRRAPLCTGVDVSPRIPCVMPEGTGSPGLLDRVHERSVLDELVAGVRAGSSGVLVLRGEAGAGKSALLRLVPEAADGCMILWATGVESESELAFAGLHILCA